MTDEMLMGKLSKIKALADRGESGEREAAENLLHRLMEKYNVNEDDIIDDSPETVEFQYWGLHGDKLFSQIVYMVTGECQIQKYTHKRNCKTRFVTCTKAQAIEIKELFEFYRNHLDVGLENYYQAFVQVEHLFPPDSINKVSSDEFNNDKDYTDILKLAMGMDKHERHLMIEEGKD